MEYIFKLGTFPNLSLAEIINVLESEKIQYKIFGISDGELHIEIQDINPEIFLKILGGTREIVCLFDGKRYKQRIKDYEKREFKKPFVDAKSGLLPAKLAKMMINLSFTQNGVKKIYDPFCGGGTIINEAMVQGIDGIGSDIDKNTVKSALKNAEWLIEEYSLKREFEFFVSDIKDISASDLREKKVDAIVTEPFLGKPSTKALKMGRDDKLNLDKVNKIITNAIKKASAILNPGQRLVIIIPRYKTRKGMKTLEISESFNRFSFKKVDPLEALHIDKSANLLYFRPKAVVIREIFILEKI